MYKLRFLGDDTRKNMSRFGKYNPALVLLPCIISTSIQINKNKKKAASKAYESNLKKEYPRNIPPLTSHFSHLV